MPAHDTGLFENTEETVDSRVLSWSLASCLELVTLSVARDSSHLFLSALVGLSGDLVSTLVTGDNGVLCLVSSREHRAVVLDLK